MLTSPSGIPYLLIQARILTANPGELAPYLHRLPKGLAMGVVMPRNARVELSIIRCFDSTELTVNSVRAFAAHAGISIADHGQVQIETRSRRFHRTMYHDIAGIEDVLVFPLDAGDTNTYLDQIREVRTVIGNYVPSLG